VYGFVKSARSMFRVLRTHLSFAEFDRALVRALLRVALRASIMAQATLWVYSSLDIALNFSTDACRDAGFVVSLAFFIGFLQGLFQFCSKLFSRVAAFHRFDER